MSDLERDLRDLLSKRASTAPAGAGGWEDLTVRMSHRHRRHQRLLAAGVAAALVVGPIAGFAVARAVEDRGTPTDRITAAGPGDGVATTEDVARFRAVSEARMAMIGDPGQQLERLFRRTTEDGIVVRAYLSRLGPVPCHADGWCPPPDCSVDASITGELSTDEAVGWANGMRYEAIERGRIRVTGSGSFGTSGEGSPARWTVVQAGDAVARVRVEYAGGTSDEMDPVDGVAVLAARWNGDGTESTVTAFDGSGNEVARVDGAEPTWSEYRLAVPDAAVSSSAVIDSAAGPVSDACVPPPPTLPAPGEQPADPAAARAAIEHAFATAYDGGLGDTPEKRDLVEDSEALVGAMEEIRNGTFAQQVEDASAKVTEIVFVSPTEAAVRYDINVENYSNFTGRIGRAKLIDGRWKVARVTVCADISLAAGSCPPAR